MGSVLEIQELFETVLLSLPIHDLLLSQRVCRKWRDTISRSPDIQKALFFRNSATKQAYAFNELLAKVFPLWFRQKHWRSSLFDFEQIKQLDWACDKKRRDAVLYKNASWRRMLVCQPALTLVVRESSSSRGGIYAKQGRIEQFTMGDLYDLTLHWLAGRLVGSFGIEWCCYPRPQSSDHNYDNYMDHGLPLDQANQLETGQDEFVAQSHIRLNLHYVVQCTSSVTGRADPEVRKFVSEAAELVPVSFDRGERVPDDPEHALYVARKVQERLNQLDEDDDDE